MPSHPAERFAKNWVVARDEGTEKSYWTCAQSKKKTYVKPACIAKEDAGMDPEAVASNWEKQVHPVSQELFWGNVLTGSTSWERPACLGPLPVAAAAPPEVTATAGPEGIAANWIERKAADGRLYWGNTVTKTTTWERPPCVPVPGVVEQEAKFDAAAFAHLAPKKSAAKSFKKGFLRKISFGKLGGPSKKDESVRFMKTLIRAKMLGARWKRKTLAAVAEREAEDAVAAAEARRLHDEEAERLLVEKEAAQRAKWANMPLNLEATIALLARVAKVRGIADAEVLATALAGADESFGRRQVKVTTFITHLLQRRCTRIALEYTVAEARAAHNSHLDLAVWEPYTIAVPENGLRLGIFVQASNTGGEFVLTEIKPGGSVDVMYPDTCKTGDIVLEINGIHLGGSATQQVFVALGGAGRPVVMKMARRVEEPLSLADVAVAATAAPQSKEGFYYAVDGEEYGPFSTTQLEQWAEEGAFTEDFDARNAQTGWVGHLSDIVQFSGAVHNVSSLSFAQKLGEKLGASRGEDALHRLASRTKQRRKSHIDLHAHVHTARIAAVPGYCERQLSAEQLRTHTRTRRARSLSVSGRHARAREGTIGALDEAHDAEIKLHMRSMVVFGVLDPGRTQRVIVAEAEQVRCSFLCVCVCLLYSFLCSFNLFFALLFQPSRAAARNACWRYLERGRHRWERIRRYGRVDGAHRRDGAIDGAWRDHGYLRADGARVSRRRRRHWSDQAVAGGALEAGASNDASRACFPPVRRLLIFVHLPALTATSAAAAAAAPFLPLLLPPRLAR
jgi:hypothetical protein